MSDSVAEAHCQNATDIKEMSDSKPDKILQPTEESPKKLENFIQNETDHVKNDDDDEKGVKSKKNQRKSSSRINREAEALLKDLGHQDQEDTELDTGRRRTRSSTRGKPATTPPPLVKREKRSSRTSLGEASVKGRRSKKNVGTVEASNGTLDQSINQREKDHVEQSRVPDTMDVSDDKQENEVGSLEVQAPPQETPHEIIFQEEEKSDINFELSMSKTSAGANGEAPIHSPKLVEDEQPTNEKDSQIA